MNHGELVDAAIQEASDRNIARLFKNHTGVARYRDKKTGKTSTVKYGVGPKEGGGYDLIGWRMSDGKFISLDAKVGRDKLSDEQEKWGKWVRHGHGIAGEFRTVEQAMELIENG